MITAENEAVPKFDTGYTVKFNVGVCRLLMDEDNWSPNRIQRFEEMIGEDFFIRSVDLSDIDTFIYTLEGVNGRWMWDQDTLVMVEQWNECFGGDEAFPRPTVGGRRTRNSSAVNEEKEALKQMIVDALQSYGGRATKTEVHRHIEAQPGDLGIKWQYHTSWRASELRKEGVMLPVERQDGKAWELA